MNGIAAITDQQAAGLIMKAVADPIIWLAMAIVFFRWQRVEEAADRAERERRGSGRGAAQALTLPPSPAPLSRLNVLTPCPPLHHVERGDAVRLHSAQLLRGGGSLPCPLR